MLNISKNSIKGEINVENFSSFKLIEKNNKSNLLIKLSLFILILLIGFSLLPWTQNITASGMVTALYPEKRPQTIHSIIPGRIASWNVNEGDLVNKGDTVAILSEIKEDYFDPNLLPNINEQISAKKSSKEFYESKANSLQQQKAALLENKKLKQEQALNKIEQYKFKIQSDSIDLVAETTNLNIALNQLERTQTLYDDGLKSLLDLEEKRQKYQERLAKKISINNKLLTSKNELINAKVMLNNIENEFNDKISKVESDRFSAISAVFETETQIKKLENQYTNYSVRSGMYYIKAPQTGYITKAFVNGLGENIKEGQPLMSILPADAKLAVEVYVKPMDIALIQKGQHVNLQFDGWPAIVFSGWNGLTFGTFDGTIVTIDNFTTIEKNLYRVLIEPDESNVAWPSAIRIGAGARGIILLNTVPIAYEIWRQINGFPPNFYEKPVNPSTDKKSKK